MMKKLMIVLILLIAVLAVLGVVSYQAVNQMNQEREEGKIRQTEPPTAAATEEPTEEETEEETEDPDDAFTGIIEEDGVAYYYVDGELQTDTIVGDEENGWHYVGSYGAVNSGYCDGVTVDGADWIVIEGDAYPVQTEDDKCLFAAAKDVAECTDTSMSREEKLKACFDYIRSKYGEGVQHDPPYPPTKSDWYIVYANDIFVGGWGDCYSFGAAYAFMGRAIGYTESYACNSTGHGWTEIEERVYDPEWSMHSKNYSYYAMTYDEKCDVPYAKALSVGAEYKRMQIVIHG